MLGDLLSTSTDASKGKYSIDGAKRGASDLKTQAQLSREGNPKNEKLTPDQITEIARHVKEGTISKPVQEAALGTYVCTNVEGCHDMPAQTFKDLKKRLSGGRIPE